MTQKLPPFMSTPPRASQPAWFTEHSSPMEAASFSEQQYWQDVDDFEIPASLLAAPLPPPIAARYKQGQRSSNGFMAYVVFAGREVGVYYNWDATNRATAHFPEKCFKGFATYELACQAWQQFILHNILPADTVVTLRGRQHPTAPHPIDPSIAGLHPPPPASVSLPQTASMSQHASGTGGVTFHIHANVSHPPSTAISRSQSQPLVSQPCAQKLSSQLARSPHPPPYYSSIPTRTPTVADLSRQHPASPSPRSRGERVSTSPESSRMAAARSDAAPVAHHLYYVVLAGQAPGVYLGRYQGEAALGPFPSAKYDTADTKQDADAMFVRAYMRRNIVRLLD